MAAAERKAKDVAHASYMKAHPGSYPDSVMRPHNGVGSDARKLASSMGRVFSGGSNWDRGMVGGLIVYRLGLASKHGIPTSLL